MPQIEINSLFTAEKADFSYNYNYIATDISLG